MAQYTLAEAAKATGKSKSTILRSIRAGRISASRDELTGGWLVEPAELHRLYAVKHDAERDAADDTPRNGHDASAIREIEARLEAERGKIAILEGVVDDLRRRLDVESEERRRLTALLTTDSRARRRWWRFGH